MLASLCARTIPRTSQTLLKVRGYPVIQAGIRPLLASWLPRRATCPKWLASSTPAGAHPASSEEAWEAGLSTLSRHCAGAATGSFSEPYVLMADIVSVRV